MEMHTATFSAYLPRDRYQALLGGALLPDRTFGSALFADMSGFTKLTDMLAQELGEQRGADELTRRLNQVFDTLVAEVDRYQGSVISFNGDAFTCWFDQDNGVRACTCALLIQSLMQGMPPISTPAGKTLRLAIKVAVAAGPARRFQVGDPAIQLIDVVAGATLARMAATEQRALQGEVLVSAEVVDALQDILHIHEWREADDPAGRVAVITGIQQPAQPAPWPPLPREEVIDEQLRPWLLAPIYQRLKAGQGQFLAELRPVAIVFISFGGIDYDNDDAAHEKLEAYVRWVQRTVTRYDGTLLQLMVGDKGSSFYCTFGAPTAHEDDAARASLAALALCNLPPGLKYIRDVRIGVTLGRTFSGAYGASSRCTYGVHGNEVSLAARLMQAASPGRPLAGSYVQRAAPDGFLWEQLDPLTVKGRSKPVSVFRLIGTIDRRLKPLLSSAALLPLVGRTAQLARISSLLDSTLESKGQFIGITAPAGLGKSRLVVEVVRMAQSRGMTVYYGGCESYATSDSYFAWQSVWHAFFDLDETQPVEVQIATLESRLHALDPALTLRLPLLGEAVNLPIPDNDLTRSLDAKLRKTALESLLVSCVQLRAQQRPLLIVLEDAHWLDQLSIELLRLMSLAITNVPVAIVTAYRTPDHGHQSMPLFVDLPNATILTLEELSSTESTELVGLKQVRLDETTVLPPEVIAEIVARAQGNPFYIEEVLNYLHDVKLAPQTVQELEQINLPLRLESLIFSRIDRLSERQRTTLKVASVIGRLFRSAWLWGFYPDLGSAPLIRLELEVLCRVELVLQEQPDPEDSYQFRHIVTHTVTYGSLPFEMRSRLHERLADYIEKAFPQATDQFVHLLAYHYDQSPNRAKQREYLWLAGQAAQAAYANSAAIDYYRKLLALIEEERRGTVLFRLGQVLDLVTEWPAAMTSYHEALEHAIQAGDGAMETACLLAIGGLSRKQSQFSEALAWLSRARDRAEVLGDPAGVVQALADTGEVFRFQGEHASAARAYDECLTLARTAAPTTSLLAAQANALKGAGTLANQQGDTEHARQYYEEALAIRRTLGDRHGEAALLNNLGMVAMFKEQHREAHALFKEGLQHFEDIGDRYAIGVLLNNLGFTARYQGDIAEARKHLEEAIILRRSLGDRWGVASSLNGLTNLLLHNGTPDGVRTMLTESLTINHEFGDDTAIAYCLEDFSGLEALTGRYERALMLAGAAAKLRAGIPAPLPPGELAAFERLLAPAKTMLADPDAALASGAALSLDNAIALALAE